MYLFLSLDEHYIIDAAGWKRGRDTGPTLTLQAAPVKAETQLLRCLNTAKRAAVNPS